MAQKDGKYLIVKDPNKAMIRLDCCNSLAFDIWMD